LTNALSFPPEQPSARNAGTAMKAIVLRNMDLPLFDLIGSPFRLQPMLTQMTGACRSPASWKR
jgi:hypothetical protein